MASLSTQILESLAHLPTDVERPIPGAALLGLGSFAIYQLRNTFNKTVDSYPPQTFAAETPNAPQLIQSIKEVRGENSVSNLSGNRRARLAPFTAILAGMAITTGSLVAEPTYTSSEVNGAANSVAIVGKSYSMNRTFDLGNPNISRADAVVKGIKNASYAGRLGIIEAGNNSQTVEPLSVNWHSHLSELSTQQVDPNGNNTLAALQLAESMLPLGTKPGSRDGSVEVFSDSVVDADPSQIADQVKTMKNEGIKVTFVVPGTAGATYKINANSQPVDSSPNPGNFAGSGAPVEQATDLAATEHDVATAIQGAGMENQEHPDGWPYLIGFGLLIGGLVKEARNKARGITG